MGGGKTNLENASYGRRNTIKGIVIGTILGGVIFGGIGAAAVTLTADQIKYTPSNENFTVTNAEEAIDELYNISNSLIGSGNLELVYSARTFTQPFSYTFTKDYKQVYIVFVGGRTSDRSSYLTTATLSNNNLVEDVNEEVNNTMGTTVFATRTYIAHSENPIVNGTTFYAEFSYNAWYHRSVMIFGVS